MKNNWKHWVLALCCVLVIGLAGCGGNGGGSSSEGESSQSSSQPVPEGDSLEGDGARKVMRDFIEALETGDRETISSWAPYAPEGTEPLYGGWAETKFERITPKILSETEGLSQYELTFVVTESGDPFFPVGESKFHATVSYPPFGELSVVELLPVEKTDFYEKLPVDTNRPGYGAFEKLNGYLNFMETTVFETVSDIPLNEIVDYALIMCSREYPEKYYYSQADVQAMVEQNFGIPYFDGTASRYYDKENDRYELWGRGGYIRNKQSHPAVYDAATKTYEITVDFYTDLLCTDKSSTVRYTLGENDNGTLRFISAVPV